MINLHIENCYIVRRTADLNTGAWVLGTEILNYSFLDYIHLFCTFFKKKKVITITVLAIPLYKGEGKCLPNST